MIGGIKKHQSRMTQVYYHLSRISDHVMISHAKPSTFIDSTPSAKAPP